MTNQTLDESTLTAAIRSALERSPDVDVYDVSVDVSGEQTTLSGSLGSFSERLAVKTVALAIPGIGYIVDELTVRPYSNTLLMTDEALLTSGREQLTTVPEIDVQRVQLTVTQRVATLSGEVGTFEQRRLARHVVECIPGMSFVHNDLTVAATR